VLVSKRQFSRKSKTRPARRTNWEARGQMSKLRCSAADIDIDKRFGRARGAHHPLVHGPEPKPWCVPRTTSRRKPSKDSTAVCGIGTPKEASAPSLTWHPTQSLFLPYCHARRASAFTDSPCLHANFTPRSPRIRLVRRRCRYPTVSLVKGSCAGDIGWNAAASEHQFFNRRHGAPDRYQMVSSGFRVGDAQSPLHTANGAYATDRHTLFSTIADRRFNRVDGGESSRRTFPSCQAYSLRLLLTPCLCHHMRRASQPSRGCRPR